jgi:hypothetical protein
MGNPIFRSARHCKELLTRWAEEELDEYVDINLFAPSHLVRMIGSRHKATGLYKTAFPSERFMGLSLRDILTISRSVRMVDMTEPRAYPPVSGLVESLKSVDRPFWIPEMDDVDDASSGALLAALQGCEEGEQWHRNHVGRSKLLFVAACGLLRQMNESAAWDELGRVNARCTPPLSQRQATVCFRSAKRTLKHEQYRRP